MGSSGCHQCPCGRRIQQETINTRSQGSPLSQKEAEDRHLPPAQQPFPELLGALQTSGLVFLADLCYEKWPHGFHGNTPAASSRAVGSSSQTAGKGAAALGPEVREIRAEEPHILKEGDSFPGL